MAIDITGLGISGTHPLAKVNVDTDEEFIYFKNTGADVIPAALVPGATFVYAPGAGSLGGPSAGDQTPPGTAGNGGTSASGYSGGGGYQGGASGGGGGFSFNSGASPSNSSGQKTNDGLIIIAKL